MDFILFTTCHAYVGHIKLVVLRTIDIAITVKVSNLLDSESCSVVTPKIMYLEERTNKHIAIFEADALLARTIITYNKIMF